MTERIALATLIFLAAPLGSMAGELSLGGLTRVPTDGACPACSVPPAGVVEPCEVPCLSSCDNPKITVKVPKPVVEYRYPADYGVKQCGGCGEGGCGHGGHCFFCKTKIKTKGGYAPMAPAPTYMTAYATFAVPVSVPYFGAGAVAGVAPGAVGGGAGGGLPGGASRSDNPSSTIPGGSARSDTGEIAGLRGRVETVERDIVELRNDVKKLRDSLKALCDSLNSN